MIVESADETKCRT